MYAFISISKLVCKWAHFSVRFEVVNDSESKKEILRNSEKCFCVSEVGIFWKIVIEKSFTLL